MRLHFLCSLILLSTLFAACGSKGHAGLEKALSSALADEKITAQQKENILGEYETLRDDDKGKARQYVEQIINAIEMGADSSHIDVVRRRFVNRGNEDVTASVDSWIIGYKV